MYDKDISPYLLRPLRSYTEVIRTIVCEAQQRGDYARVEQMTGIHETLTRPLHAEIQAKLFRELRNVKMNPIRKNLVDKIWSKTND